MNPQASAKLEQLKPGTYCFHRSWGVGKITSWDEDTEQMFIDFRTKKNHAMEFEYAAQSLKPLAQDHIEARILDNASEVKAQSESDPSGLMQNVIQSFGAEATTDRIEKLFVPTVMAPDQWKKWWDSAKRAMKKDPRFQVPSKRTEVLTFNQEGNDHNALAVEEIKRVMGAKDQAKAVLKLEKLWKSSDNQEIAQQIIEHVNRTIQQTPKNQFPSAVELAVVRDDFVEKVGLPKVEGPMSLRSLLPADIGALGRLLDNLPASCQTRCLEESKTRYSERWAEMFFNLLPGASSKMMDIFLGQFRRENRVPELVSALERLVRERKLNPDLLVWICKNRNSEVEPLVGPQLMTAILAVLEYDQLADYKKGTKLHDMLLNDKDVVKDLLAKASNEEVRDITRAVLLTPVFEELNKRSLLAIIVKLYPFVQGMIIGESRTQHANQNAQGQTTQPLVVSWESLERRKKELEDIVTKKIPENTKDIAVARGYGDLKENHEFKAAKEMQTVLMRRKAELEQAITVAQGTDFSNVSTTEVSIGTKVSVLDVDAKEKQTYTILGAWDSEPEKGVISYLTAVAKEMLGKKVGAEVLLPEDSGGKRKVRIESIEAYKK
jgi:transcription elongation GreA/GreB family factor